ncbi:phage portal protein [Lacunimicrobium album]
MFNYIKSLFTSETRSKSLDITDLTVKTTDYPEFFYGPTESGVTVDAHSIMGNPAVSRGVALISNFAGNIPVTCYERTGKGRLTAKKKSVYWLLSYQPAPQYPIKQFMTSLFKNAIIWGNAYAVITRNDKFEPVKLTIVPPSLVAVEVHPEMLVYSITTNGEPVKIPDYNMIHIRGIYPSEDGIMGLSLFSVLAEALGLGLALQKHGASYFANAVSPDQYLVVPQAWGDDKEKRDQIQKNWKEKYVGTSNRGTIPVLYAGMELKQLVQTNNAASQFIEARQFDLVTVANALNLPASALNVLQNVSYGSLTQDQLNLLTMSIDPWLRAVEQELFVKLLSTEEQRSESHYFEFDVENALRLDIPTKIESLNSQRNNGNISFPEWREKMNMTTQMDVKNDSDWFVPNGVRTLREIELGIEERKLALEERKQAIEVAKKAAEQPENQQNENTNEEPT